MNEPLISWNTNPTWAVGYIQGFLALALLPIILGFFVLLFCTRYLPAPRTFSRGIKTSTMDYSAYRRSRNDA